MVQALLDAGDIARRGLKDAICNHRTDIVRLLLTSTATHYVDDRSGWALRTACRYGHTDMMKLLLDSGADPLACDGECMRRACRKGTVYKMCTAAAATHYKEMYRSLRHGEDSFRCGR